MVPVTGGGTFKVRSRKGMRAKGWRDIFMNANREDRIIHSCVLVFFCLGIV